MEVDTMSVEEKLNQAKGAIKEGVGKVTDDKKTEKEEVAEDAKEAVEGAIEGVKNMVKKDDK